MEPTKAKVTNPLKDLQAYGQSVWLDNIRRSLITGNELRHLVEEDGLRGVTSNPSIFEKAITGSTDYTTILEELASQNLDAKSIYERLAIRDIQDAADVLRPVYEQTKRRDGYVSLEVSPQLAHNTQGTIEEARRLWQTVRRDNLMVKVPATAAGIPAIKQLIGEGINVNVTLLFSQQAYEQVAEAYIAGLEQLASGGGDVSRIASVASFFISRIDTAIDALLTDRLKTSTNASELPLLRSIMGRVAIANAKVTYQRYKQRFSGERWQKLAHKGAQPQRLLWASTSSKNPQYRDVIYVEELVGRDTVNTVPPATLDAFRDHGVPRASLEEDVKGAQDTMWTLGQVGISMKEVTDKLLDDGVTLFAEAFDKLLKAVDRGCKGETTARINRQTYTLPKQLATALDQSLDDWETNEK